MTSSATGKDGRHCTAPERLIAGYLTAPLFLVQVGHVKSPQADHPLPDYRHPPEFSYAEAGIYRVTLKLARRRMGAPIASVASIQGRWPPFPSDGNRSIPTVSTFVSLL